MTSGVGWPAVGRAQGDRTAGAFDLFFQLGLPETRGAKWVTAHGPGVPMNFAMQQGRGAQLSGNAWLVREEPDGTVELVVEQSRRVRLQRGDRTARLAGKSSLPRVHITPAELDKDVDKFAASYSNKPSVEDGTESHGDDYRHEAAQRAHGSSLLFLAHLHRQGRTDFAAKLLPQVLVHAPSPDTILDQAISMLADGRLADASGDWVTRGDAAAFAKAIEQLTTAFSRGWKSREAALLLLERVRAPQPARGAEDAAAKKAAALLLALRSEQLRELPRGRNWLLPGTAGGASSSALAMAMMSGLDDLAVAPELAADEPLPPAASATPLSAFFAESRRAAAALAHLLDDHRLLRVVRTSSGFNRNFHFGQPSREEVLKSAYEALPRPYELGEIAASLLQPLLPDEVLNFTHQRELDPARVLAWIESIAKLTDEQLAWDYLRRAQNPHDTGFLGALSYLVEHGNPETLKKLEEVFADPAAWSGNADDTIVPLLTGYVKRLGSGAEAFGGKLKEAVKAAIEDEQREEGSLPESFSAERKKQAAQEAAARLKQIDQILKPRGLSELLAEIVAGDGEEAEALLGTLAPAVAQTPWPEAEAQLFQAAAKAKEPAMKHQLLTLIAQQARTAKSASPGALTAATAEALGTLLADDASADAEETEDDVSEGESGQTVAQRAASAFLWRRLSPAEQQAWQQLAQEAPQIANEWSKARARAVAKGEPPTPLPDAQKISAEQLGALVDKLAPLAPADVLKQFTSLVPDEQLALARHLAKLDQWPPALAAAHFTITTINGPAEARARFEALRGRRFDEATLGEISAIAVKAAQEGQGFLARLTPSGTLAGLALTCTAQEQTITPEQLKASGLPGLSGKPSPNALLACYLQGGTGEELHGRPAGYAQPVWKDADITAAWRAEHLKTDTAPAKPQPADELEETPFGGAGDRSGFEKRLRAILALDMKSRGPFSVMWLVSTVENDSDP